MSGANAELISKGSIAASFSTVRSGADCLFANSASWVAMRATSGVARILILLAIARAYGPVEFGKLSLAISIVEILRAFSDFGIDTVSIRKFAQTEPSSRRALLDVIFGAKLVLAACFYTSGTAALLLITRDHFTILAGAIIGLSLFLSSGVGAVSSYLQSYFSMSRMFRTAFVANAIALVFASAAILVKAPLLVVIVSLPLADCLNLGLFCSTSKLHFSPRFDFRRTLDLVRESLPVGIMLVVVMLYFRIDNLFVFKFAGPAALGLYAACFRIIEPALIVPHSFATTAYTVLCSSERNNDSASDVTRTIFRTMWPAYVLVGGFTIILLSVGRRFLGWLFPMYLPAFPILLILSGTLFIRSLNMGLTTVFNSRAMYSTVTKISAVNLAINIVLVLLLTPAYGAIGAAWAALLTESLNTLIQGRAVGSLLRTPGFHLALNSIRTDG